MKRTRQSEADRLEGTHTALINYTLIKVENLI